MFVLNLISGLLVHPPQFQLVSFLMLPVVLAVAVSLIVPALSLGIHPLLPAPFSCAAAFLPFVSASFAPTSAVPVTPVQTGAVCWSLHTSLHPHLPFAQPYMSDPCSSVLMGNCISMSLSWALFFNSLIKLNHTCMATIQDSRVHSSWIQQLQL